MWHFTRLLHTEKSLKHIEKSLHVIFNNFGAENRSHKQKEPNINLKQLMYLCYRTNAKV